MKRFVALCLVICSLVAMSGCQMKKSFMYMNPNIVTSKGYLWVGMTKEQVDAMFEGIKTPVVAGDVAQFGRVFDEVHTYEDESGTPQLGVYYVDDKVVGMLTFVSEAKGALGAKLTNDFGTDISKLTDMEQPDTRVANAEFGVSPFHAVYCFYADDEIEKLGGYMPMTFIKANLSASAIAKATDPMSVYSEKTLAKYAEKGVYRLIFETDEKGKYEAIFLDRLY